MPRPLKVGVQLPEVEYVARWPQIREMAEVAEAIGLDSLWLGDHLLYRDEGEPATGPWEAWTMLAAIAAITSRVQIGPLVAATSFHNPAMLAKKAAALDEISDGRLILGLGAGWNETEYRAFGFPFDHRVSRFEEAFTIIRTLLREGRMDFQGSYYQLEGCELLPRAARPQGPPLMVGSEGERMLSISLPHVDAWNAWFTWFGNSPDGYRPLRRKIDDAARAAGRNPDEVKRTVALLVRMGDGGGRIQGGYSRQEVEPIPGEADVLAAVLRKFADEGVAHVQLVLDPITADSIRALRPTLERLDA